MSRRNAWVASCSRAMLRAAIFSLASLPVLALAQGVLVVTGSGPPIRLPRPIPPAPTPPAHCYKIKEIDVHARLAGQVAQVQVSQSFVNTGSQPLEVSFIFPLPYDGAVDRLTLLIDGKELLGVGRLAADPGFEQAEFALVVASDRQGHGYGTLLLDHVLHYAKARGVQRVVGHVLRENHKMLELSKRLGFKREGGRSGEPDIRVVKATASL